jgi:hypothetical protein
MAEDLTPAEAVKLAWIRRAEEMMATNRPLSHPNPTQRSAVGDNSNPLPPFSQSVNGQLSPQQQTLGKNSTSNNPDRDYLRLFSPINDDRIIYPHDQSNNPSKESLHLRSLSPRFSPRLCTDACPEYEDDTSDNLAQELLDLRSLSPRFSTHLTSDEYPKSKTCNKDSLSQELPHLRRLSARPSPLLTSDQYPKSQCYNKDSQQPLHLQRLSSYLSPHLTSNK